MGKFSFQKLRERQVWQNLRARAHQAGSSWREKGLRAFEQMPSITHLCSQLPRLRYPAFALLGLVSADTAMQGLGSYLIKGAPRPSRSAPRAAPAEPYLNALNAYGSIAARNPFCPGCPIPELERVRVEKPKDCNQADPVQDSSVQIIGTIVLSDPRHSVATIQRGSQETQAIQQGDQVQGLGEVFEIRQHRICFLPPSGNGVQYVEMPEEPLRFGQPIAASAPISQSSAPKRSPIRGIEQINENEFDVSRNTLNQYLNDPNILFQAHAVPHRVDGAIEGFKVLSIQPGSVYEGLGVQVGDIIKGINGEPMDSMAKAQEAFMALRSSSNLSITVNRNGNDVTQKYSIK